jgi:hypothetical protein
MPCQRRASKARRAPATAWSTSAVSQSGMAAIVLPSIGETTSSVLPDSAPVSLPSMMACTVGIGSFSASVICRCLLSSMAFAPA